MAENINGLEIRRILGRKEWAPPRPFGPDGYMIQHLTENKRVIVSAGPTPEGADDEIWVHASMGIEGRVPTYEELVLLHKAVFGDKWAYQVFAPPADHVNIHPNVLHLWGRLDGEPAMPNFGALGLI